MEYEGDAPVGKRRTGKRCMVYGCSNEAQHGYFTHKMPGKMPSGQERFNALQESWISFIGRTRKFDTLDAREYTMIIVCCGHFVKEDYEPTDVMMFKQGLRKQAPSLKKNTVPSLDVAQHPFSPSGSCPSSSRATISSPVISSSSFTCSTTTVALASLTTSVTSVSVLHTPETSCRVSKYNRKKAASVESGRMAMSTRSGAIGLVKQPSMSMVCEEEKLSESQLQVYQEWEKRVKVYDDLMKKHKEEEVKYQKAVKAVDTRVGLKDGERQNANGPTKFLRSVPTSGSQPISNATSVALTSSVQPRALTSNLPRPGVAPLNHTAGQNLTVQMNGKQQLSYGGNQLPGRAPGSVASPGVKMLVGSSSQHKTVLSTAQSFTPGIVRPGTYVIQNGMPQQVSNPNQPGVRWTNPQTKVLHPTVKTGNSYPAPPGARKVSLYPDNQAVKGQKRPAESPSIQVNKRAKEDTIDAKVLMKYYPFKKGKILTTDDASRRFKIKCFHCNETMASNIQYATHVKKIVEKQWPDPSSLNAIIVCPRCFKRFRSPHEMREHLERSHVKGAVFQCFTCDLSFSNNESLIKHMTMFHTLSQMPFCCQLCQYRTSAYADIMEHFSLKHEGYKALMCPYCLKMLRCSKTFFRHCNKHILTALRNTTSVFPCKNCKLSFFTTAERAEHVDKDHRHYDPKDRDGVPRYVRDTLKSLEIMASAGIMGHSSPASKPQDNQVLVGKKTAFKYSFTQQTSLNRNLACMECGQLLQNFATHFNVLHRCTYFRCSYVTFCPRTFANHMILFHRVGRPAPFLGGVKKKKNSDGTVSLTCKICNYQTKAPTHMAHHRAKKCIKTTSMEWISYLHMAGQSVKESKSAPSKVVDVIVLDSDDDA